MLSIATAVYIEEGTELKYGNVTYTSGLNLTLEQLEVYDNGIILNITDNISIDKASQLNITILEWSSVINRFGVNGTGEATAFLIKVNDTLQQLCYNGNGYTSVVSFTTGFFNYALVCSTLKAVVVIDDYYRKWWW